MAIEKRLVVATRNRGKVAELAEMLGDMAVSWLSLDDAAVTETVPETGETFRENAVLKAREYARMTGLLTLADDSGLEVDALNGRPGVHTARYGGEGLSDAERYQLLLQELGGLPEAERTARFRCVMALVGGDGRLHHTSEGICPGRIAAEPAGEGGFGYDPVFYLPERGRTMAQLPPEVKNAISHRGRALRAMAPALRRVLGAGE
jgi:XTP/dITP diphosphohydrolase